MQRIGRRRPWESSESKSRTSFPAREHFSLCTLNRCRVRPPLCLFRNGSCCSPGRSVPRPVPQAYSGMPAVLSLLCRVTACERGERERGNVRPVPANSACLMELLRRNPALTILRSYAFRCKGGERDDPMPDAGVLIPRPAQHTKTKDYTCDERDSHTRDRDSGPTTRTILTLR